MLLTDGTVMVQGPNVTKRWDRLNPDAKGNYLGGTWTPIASMNLERLYFGSNVLPSGKVFLLGGEYSGPAGSSNWTNTGEMYDPVANAWTNITSFPQSNFGDDPTVLLPSGKVLCGYLSGPQTYLYDPGANSWAQTGTKLRSDQSDEETWVMLPDSSVLSYDIFASPPSGPGSAQRYVPATGVWVDAGSVPVPLSGSNFGYELGPATLLPNGTVIQIGANENTAIYTPSTNKWKKGPRLPTGMGADDAPGVMLPNGHFLFVADHYLFNGPSRVFDYDYKRNRLKDVTPGGEIGNVFARNAAYYMRFLMLPNGHVLFSDGNQLWDYDSHSDGGPQDAWRPTISQITLNGSTYTLTGTQLTGISQGASYGDDAEMDTNYPIVSFADSQGNVWYAKTTNWTPGVATGSQSVSVQFTLPAGLPGPGTYNVTAIANGIPSAAKSLNVAMTRTIRVAYNSGANTLTLSGDAGANALTISKSGNGVTLASGDGSHVALTVDGAAQDQPAASKTISNVQGSLSIQGDLGAGDDSLSLIGLSINLLDVKLSAGSDKVYLSYCHVGKSAIDGGDGNDIVVAKFGAISKQQDVNIP